MFFHKAAGTFQPSEQVHGTVAGLTPEPHPLRGSYNSVATMSIRSKIMVYHSSKTRGLKTILPSTSTHGRKWVYATKDLVLAALFLATTGGDFTCCIGRDKITGKPYLCERFRGAFDLR